MRKEPLVLVLVTSLYYIITSYYSLPKSITYIIPILFWASLLLLTLYYDNFSSPLTLHQKMVSYVAIAISLVQIFIKIDVGLFLGFGKNFYSQNPINIILNTIFFFTKVISIEFTRSFLLRSWVKRRPVLTIFGLTIFYTIINTQIRIVMDLETIFLVAEYLGKDFLPLLSQNLLLTYLSIFGGPISALAFITPIKMFELYIPIQPDLSWGWQAFLGVVPPAIGSLYVNQVVKPLDLMRAGLYRNKRDVLFNKKENENLTGWSLLMIFTISALFFTTGLFDVYPTVPISGSMQPALEVGDVAIIYKERPEKIQIGDVIQYRHEGKTILHRVVSIQRGERDIYFFTKGDANDQPDNYGISSRQLKGKMIYSFKKMGWPVLVMKEKIGQISDYLKTTELQKLIDSTSKNILNKINLVDSETA